MSEKYFCHSQSNNLHSFNFMLHLSLVCTRTHKFCVHVVMDDKKKVKSVHSSNTLREQSDILSSLLPLFIDLV